MPAVAAELWDRVGRLCRESNIEAQDVENLVDRIWFALTYRNVGPRVRSLVHACWELLPARLPSHTLAGTLFLIVNEAWNWLHTSAHPHNKQIFNS